jgi:hypothetical protein
MLNGGKTHTALQFTEVSASDDNLPERSGDQERLGKPGTEESAGVLSSVLVW